MSAFDANSPYGASSYDPYGPAPTARSTGGGAPSASSGAAPNLQFYSSNTAGGLSGSMSGGGGGDGYAGRTSLEGNMTGAYGAGGPSGHMMATQMSFWSAFGTGGFPHEPGLMEGESRRHALSLSS